MNDDQTSIGPLLHGVWTVSKRRIGRHGDKAHRTRGIDVRRREQPRRRITAWPVGKRVIGHLPPEEK